MWQAKYAEIAQEKLGKELQPKDPGPVDLGRLRARPRSSSPRAINPDSPTRYGTVLQMKNLLFNMMVFGSRRRAPTAATGWTTRASHRRLRTPYRKGLELYKMLYDAGATPEDSLSYEYAEANAAFGSGQVGDDAAVERRRRAT